MQGEDLKEIRRELGLSQEAFAEALGMTATFIGMMERDERPIERRTALAARQLHNERSRLYDNHRVVPMAGDVALEDAQIIWDRHGEFSPSVKVVGGSVRDDDRYSCSYGSCNGDYSRADNVGKLLRLFAKFIEISALDGIPAAEVHEAFSVIPEYRYALSFGMFSAGVEQ